jgi:hypothetical protein
MKVFPYFENPTQIAYQYIKGGLWNFGIAYKNEIINSVSGAIILVDSVKVIKPLSWVPLSEEICGDTLDEEIDEMVGWEYDKNLD